ncbi:MAG: hypothetical protein HY678_08530 [Chloroflexi bacterium]|nr:hypothetical protein [Chloroflexota bacterium]
MDSANGGQSVAIFRGRAYVLYGGLWIFDLADPAAHEEVGYYDTGASVLQVHGDLVYLRQRHTALSTEAGRVVLEASEELRARMRELRDVVVMGSWDQGSPGDPHEAP